MKKFLLLSVFWTISSLAIVYSQDILFSYTINNSHPTNIVVSIYAQFDGTGNPNAAGYTAVFYYNNGESTSTISNVNMAPTTALGWVNTPNDTYSNNPSTNPNVPITFTNRIEIATFDNNFIGTNFTTTPTLLATITFNKSAGLPNTGGEIYMGSTVPTDPGIVYFDSGFTGYAVVVTGDPEGLLPVELISFNANKFEERHSKITWTTSTEINSKQFNVQRSFDNKVWNNIGTLEAQGYSQIAHNYEFIDQNVYNGTDARLNVFYRLITVDVDNQFNISPIKSVLFTGTGSNVGREVSVYPNPSSEGVQLEWDADRVDQPTSIEFFNSKGELVYTSKVPENSNQQYINYDQTAILPGLYIIRIISGTEAIEHKQIIVTQR